MPKTSVADVDRMRSVRRETTRLEFKSAKKTFEKREVAKYCCALANEGGGYLLLGIGDDVIGSMRPVVGTEAFPDPDVLLRWILQVCGFRVDVDVVDHPDGRVLVFKAPPRPQGTPYQIDGSYWMRLDEHVVPMTIEKLKEIIGEGAPDWGEIVTLDGLSPKDVVNLLDIDTFFGLLQLPQPGAAELVVERLVSKRLLVRRSGDFGITRLCALLLAKKNEDFPDVARKAPRVVRYAGTDKLQTTIDVPGTKGYAVGFEGLVTFVMQQMPRAEVIDGPLRRYETLVPEIVIRELVANALVHQDLELSGTSPVIEIYDDRIEISNPGTPVVEPDRFIDENRSRNEQLAELMRAFRVCEERGTGVDKVITAAEASGLLAPNIRAGVDRTHVVVFGAREFSEMTMDDRIRAAYQHCSLKYVSSQYMTNQTLRARFNLADDKMSSVSAVIDAAKKAQMIKADEAVGGSRKLARYTPYWA